jgi:excinuclease ABC subunit C
MNHETFETLPLDNRKRLLDELPASNGIYIFVKGWEIQYIGKSVNIKARVLSHIESAKLDAKEAAIVTNSDRIRFFITDNELKALILESKLIQKHKPPYNVRWRDDKSYLYIKVTVRDQYPKVFLSRRENDGKSRYFGPFLSSRIAQDIVRTTRKIIPFCTQKNVTKRACFYSKIGQCNPCPNVVENTKDPELKKELQKEYKSNIKKVIRFFEGKTDLLLKDLYKQMTEYSGREQFEEAMALRNKILRFENFLYGRAHV